MAARSCRIFGDNGRIGRVVLVIGRGGRWAALLLFGLNIIASISYGPLSEAALQEAFYWGILFLYFVLHGPGLLSVDALSSYWFRRRQSKSGNGGNVPSQKVLHTT